MSIKKNYAPMRRFIGIILVAMTMVFGLTNPASAALIDNGDGTITDDCLGIMWLQESFDEAMTWNDAMAWADNLVFAGYDDWRLPSAIHFENGWPDTVWNSVNNEWGHLYGVEWNNPAYPSDILPMTGYQCLWYWTSTEHGALEAYAFFISYDGLWLNEKFPKTETFCVTAVRGKSPPPPVLPPVANFTESAHSVFAGQSVSFDPSGSYDPDGTIVLYEWDFDGDGIYDYSSTSPEVVSFTYEEEGTYTVTLRVTDNDGLTDTFAATKTVRPLWIIVTVVALVVSIVAVVVGVYYFVRRRHKP